MVPSYWWENRVADSELCLQLKEVLLQLRILEETFSLFSLTLYLTRIMFSCVIYSSLKNVFLFIFNYMSFFKRIIVSK